MPLRRHASRDHAEFTRDTISARPAKSVSFDHLTFTAERWRPSPTRGVPPPPEAQGGPRSPCVTCALRDREREEKGRGRENGEEVADAKGNGGGGKKETRRTRRRCCSGDPEKTLSLGLAILARCSARACAPSGRGSPSRRGREENHPCCESTNTILELIRETAPIAVTIGRHDSSLARQYREALSSAAAKAMRTDKERRRNRGGESAGGGRRET